MAIAFLTPKCPVGYEKNQITIEYTVVLMLPHRSLIEYALGVPTIGLLS